MYIMFCIGKFTPSNIDAVDEFYAWWVFIIENLFPHLSPSHTHRHSFAILFTHILRDITSV